MAKAKVEMIGGCWDGEVTEIKSGMSIGDSISFPHIATTQKNFMANKSYRPEDFPPVDYELDIVRGRPVLVLVGMNRAALPSFAR